jgi:ABC-2 type transport system permease protein
MNAFVHHFAYDFRTGLRDKSQLLMNYLFPLFIYLMMGLLMTGVNPNFRLTLIPAMMIIGIMSSGLLGLPNPIVAAREAGIFRSFKINGVPALNILNSPLLSTIAHMTIVTALIALTAKPLFNAGLPSGIQWLVLFVLSWLTSFAMAGLGVLIGVVSTNSRTTVLIAQLVFLPSMLLGGMMMPTSMLPPTLARISMLLPASHAMNALSGYALGMTTTFSPLFSVLILLAGGVLAFGLAIYLFDWDSHNTQHQRPRYLALIALIPYIIGALLLG